MENQENLLGIARYMGMGLVRPESAGLMRADGALVFCREDPAVAAAAASLYHQELVEWVVLTGGIGKDSGEFSKKAGSEAARQMRLLVDEHRVPAHVIYLEERAKNGAENSRFGIDTILHFGLPHDKIILVMHPRNAHRVYAVQTKIAREEKKFVADYQMVCTRDPFDATNPAHKKELLSEFLRVADWPASRWSDPQPDLPEELVTWAREEIKK